MHGCVCFIGGGWKCGQLSHGKQVATWQCSPIPCCLLLGLQVSMSAVCVYPFIIMHAEHLLFNVKRKIIQFFIWSVVSMSCITFNLKLHGCVCQCLYVCVCVRVCVLSLNIWFLFRDIGADGILHSLAGYSSNLFIYWKLIACQPPRVISGLFISSNLTSPITNTSKHLTYTTRNINISRYSIFCIAVVYISAQSYITIISTAPLILQSNLSIPVYKNMWKKLSSNQQASGNQKR